MRPLSIAILLAVLQVLVAGGEAAPARKAILDPTQAGIDFRVQGEYAGTLANGEKYGVQVIALGGDRFRAVGYVGGLPGAGWNREMPAASEAVGPGGKVTFTSDQGRGEIDLAAGPYLTLFDPGGQTQGKLERVERVSPTLGLAPPQGAVVLFDGSQPDAESAGAWKGGRALNGQLQVSAITKESFGDCALHCEFLLPYMPESRGQGRSNSGLFFQLRYEIQILDSFGLEGRENECGAIYEFRRPDVNMCFPPLVWQTYDVEFRMARFDDQGKKTENARMTVKQNGVTIHDNVELARSGPEAWKTEETPARGPFRLQFHGSPVQVRNFWVAPK